MFLAYNFLSCNFLAFSFKQNLMIDNMETLIVFVTHSVKSEIRWIKYSIVA